MKENSKKILLFLYPSENEPVWFSFTELQSLVPNLSSAGLQSALFLLDKKELLRIDKTQVEPKYSLSSYGKSYLEDLFPALCESNEKWQGDWSLLIFLEAPKTDKNFRYLRSYLTQNKAIALARAVYLYPGFISEKIKTDLERSYKNSVLVLKVSEWIFGDDFKVIGQKAELNDLFELYSSISKELDRLISVKLNEKSFTQQEKDSFFSALSRFLSILDNDPALLRLYFPQVESARQLLVKLQKCLRI
jgi:DNA-binding transcriptional regulator PaaX